jgi:hypothetical protein
MKITTHIAKQDAERLIGLAGGERHPRGGYTLHGTHYWCTDEALTMALIDISQANGSSKQVPVPDGYRLEAVTLLVPFDLARRLAEGAREAADSGDSRTLNSALAEFDAYNARQS